MVQESWKSFYVSGWNSKHNSVRFVESHQICNAGQFPSLKCMRCACLRPVAVVIVLISTIQCVPSKFCQAPRKHYHRWDIKLLSIKHSTLQQVLMSSSLERHGVVSTRFVHSSGENSTNNTPSNDSAPKTNVPHLGIF